MTKDYSDEKKLIEVGNNIMKELLKLNQAKDVRFILKVILSMIK